jgi:hypothetical protein
MRPAEPSEMTRPVKIPIALKASVSEPGMYS